MAKININKNDKNRSFNANENSNIALTTNYPTAIKITQDIKDKNRNSNFHSFVINNPVGAIVRASIPNVFHVTAPVGGGYKNRADLHDADGWKEIVEPEGFDPSIHKKGSLIDHPTDATKFIYERIDKTDQEIQIEKEAESDSNRQILIQQKIEEKIISEAQDADDTESLNNQSLFPMWLFPFNYSIGFKCQAFDGLELKLYKCVQAHTSQSDWHPTLVPALFTPVAYPNQIPDFVQPAGAQDAYQTGDQVMFQGQVWESLIDANVWSPVTYPAGWKVVVI